MTAYYLDTSALIKRYVQETGTDWVRSLLAPDADHTPLTARISTVEVYSALARRRREGSVPAADCDIAAKAFTNHCADEYEFVEFEEPVITRARDLLDHHPLRAYDAVQLSSALIANQALLNANEPPLVFLSADNRLLAVAIAEQLSADNPNAHV